MIQIVNSQALPFEQELSDSMERATSIALNMLGAPRAVVSAALVDDERIRELNRQYRGIDKPTDVLSFAAREGEQLHSGRKGEYLGDIAISLETAARQADEFGHSLSRELAFLTVHGVLHLLGYDHMVPEDEKEMRALQNKIMQRAGLSVKGE